MSFIEMRDIVKTFGATVALDDANVYFEKGEVHALVGENGSGKSTLMRILAGATPADKGLMRINGQSYRPTSPMDARRIGVSMIHQELAICPDLTIAENVLLGMEQTRFGILDRKLMRVRVAGALDFLGHEGLDVDQLAGSLPIGLRQIVEVARAVAIGTEVLILDEPTSSLSEPDVKQLLKVIRALRLTGKAIIYISHFLDEVQEVADRVTVLRDGKVVATNLAERFTQDEIVSLMVGRQMEAMYQRSPREPGDVMLSTRGLSGAERPLIVDLELRRGEVLGISGLNGSGRTELLRCIFGLDAVTSGQVRVGHYAGPLTPQESWSAGAGMLSEDRKAEGLALDLSIADNLTLTRLPKAVSEKQMATSTSTWIDRCSIKAQDPWQPVGSLSGGNQQKVAFARLLYHDVDILLLDEPTRGIDVGSKQQIYEMIDDLAKGGKAVLMVSSYLPELLGVCDRIAVMRRGELGASRPVGELTQESIMREATGV